jgi:hypothetical protein
MAVTPHTGSPSFSAGIVHIQYSNCCNSKLSEQEERMFKQVQTKLASHSVYIRFINIRQLLYSNTPQLDPEGFSLARWNRDHE